MKFEWFVFFMIFVSAFSGTYLRERFDKWRAKKSKASPKEVADSIVSANEPFLQDVVRAGKVPIPGVAEACMRHYRKIRRGAGHDRLWLWFGLRRASWLTIPRALLHEMPDEWQGRLADLLAEYVEAFPNQPDLGTTVRTTDLSGKLVPVPKWMLNYRHPDFAAIDELRGECNAKD